jgi:hypothetical protein
VKGLWSPGKPESEHTWGTAGSVTAPSGGTAAKVVGSPSC